MSVNIIYNHQLTPVLWCWLNLHPMKMVVSTGVICWRVRGSPQTILSPFVYQVCLNQLMPTKYMNDTQTIYDKLKIYVISTLFNLRIIVIHPLRLLQLAHLFIHLGTHENYLLTFIPDMTFLHFFDHSFMLQLHYNHCCINARFSQ